MWGGKDGFLIKRLNPQDNKSWDSRMLLLCPMRQVAEVPLALSLLAVDPYFISPDAPLLPNS